MTGSPCRLAAVLCSTVLLALLVAGCEGRGPTGPGPGGGTLTARVSFAYDGHRTDEFEVDADFELTAQYMVDDDAAWAFTQYWNDQFMMAQRPRDDGWVDLLLCWAIGPRVTQPGTRQLDCILEVGTSLTGRLWSDEQPAEHAYSALIGGTRLFDDSGVITFSTVTPQRLAGTFSITMHSEYDPAETIQVVDGTFDVPVVSDLFNF